MRGRGGPLVFFRMGLVVAGLLATACAGVPALPPPPAEGLRLVMGAPPTGLPWRLHLEDTVTPERPLRLLVWMHPSGGSANALVEPLAPAFVRRGWALLVVTEKDFSGWRGEEANRLMLGTLPDVARVPGVDACRPVLLGFSAGAQMALELWAARPGAFGGLVLLAGAPRFSRGDEDSPPRGPVPARVPLLALAGERDGSVPLWRDASRTWPAAGLLLAGATSGS
jgi:predicted esterase